MEFLKLIYLSLIKKQKKKRGGKFSHFSGVFFLSPWTILLIKALLIHSEGHVEARPRAR